MVSLKNIENYVKENEKESKDADILSDVRYICNSCSLITESLQKGCDVLQLPNGDIFVTALKPVTFQYSWDDKKGKLVRVQVGTNRAKKSKKPSKEEIHEIEHEDDLETV